jgi:hypothetical protein
MMKRSVLLVACLLLVACARPVPATPALVPPELSIEEHALTQRPEAEYTQLYFAEGSQEAILAVHAGERSQLITLLDLPCSAGASLAQCATLGTDRLVAWADYTGGLFGSGTVTLTRNDSRIYQIPVGDSSPIGSLRGLWTYDTNHRSGNEIDSQALGQISVDGQLLNKQSGYQEAFGFQTLHGRPFYFFEKQGAIGISYDGVEIPLDYSEVPHYGCCSAATLNPRVYQNMVAFFARKGDTWYYVEIGVFDQTAP